jgi:hypothetical protein
VGPAQSVPPDRHVAAATTNCLAAASLLPIVLTSTFQAMEGPLMKERMKAHKGAWITIATSVVLIVLIYGWAIPNADFFIR